MAIQTKFYGQQDGERILATIHPHNLALVSPIIKIILVVPLIFFIVVVVNSAFPNVSGLVSLIGLIVAAVTLVGGIWAIVAGEHKNVTYITDRRVVRFRANTTFMVESRSLSWQDAVKIKTYPPNFIWRMFNVGNVVVHSHSTFVSRKDATNNSVLSDDDIDLHDVYYYRDIGNYMDKILYLYRQSKEELKTLRPFIYKPRGKRY